MEKIHSVLFGTATIRQYLKYLTKINDIDTYKKNDQLCAWPTLDIAFPLYICSIIPQEQYNSY